IMTTFEEYKSRCHESLETGDFTWLKNLPYDTRFPNVNQTPYCKENYVDFHRCKRIYGEEYKPCNYFIQAAKLACPSSWINKWDTQVENNMFPYEI
ncbi:Cytochrome c oxidase subunit 6B, partial [Schistosoma japonicum]